MGEQQQSFKRYEVKYLLNEDQYREFRERTKHRLITDAYGETDICNVYYDTSDYRLIRNSMEKGIYKEKLRLRSYGMPKECSSKVYLELKKKYQGIVYKRRECLEYEQAQKILTSGSEGAFCEEELDSQILREILWVLKYYETLHPAMFLSYQRIAMYDWKDMDAGGLRVTFDRNIVWRTRQADLRSGIYGEPLLEPGQRIMEVKVPEAMPMWFVKLLDDMKLYPVSYSKYGRAYEQTQLRKISK